MTAATATRPPYPAPRGRLIPALALAAALAAPSACSHGPPPGVRGEGKNGLTVVVSQATYAPGEKVILAVTLTNRDAEPCRMQQVTEGAVTIRAMTRDGAPVSPTFSGGGYIDGFNSFLLQNLVVVAPGGSVSVPWVSHPSVTTDRLSLRTATMAPLDMADTAYWPVDRPGRYELTVSYRVPPMDERAPPDLCRITDTATVGFAVAEGK